MEYSMRQRAVALVFVLAGLAGCHHNRTGSNDVLSVMPSSSTVSAVVGGSQTLQISFNSSDGHPLSQLSVMGDLGALPVGWSGPATFQCAPVGTGNGCELNLSYAPFGTGSGALTLSYSYRNNAGVPLSGTLVTTGFSLN